MVNRRGPDGAALENEGARRIWRQNGEQMGKIESMRNQYKVWLVGHDSSSNREPSTPNLPRQMSLKN